MKLLRLLMLPFAALVVILARLGLPIRFGEIFSSRIGHMAGNMECYFNEKAAGLSKGWDWWYHRCEPCNAQLGRMLDRKLRVRPAAFIRLCATLNCMFKGWEKQQIDTVHIDRDIHNLIGKYPPHFQFTEAEERRGEAGLVAMGIPTKAKWVCLIVRDAAYLPHFAYHSFRDSDPDSYAQAALMLAKRGYYVLRMGAKVEKPFTADHERVIDYATKHRSDFMDIYLAAKCEFALSNGNGLDAVCTSFHRPVCFVNFTPLEYLATWLSRSLAIWKHHVKDGKRMTPAEIWATGAGLFQRAEQYVEAGITLIDNTPEEITEAAREMAEQVRGENVYDDYEKIFQENFWRTFPNNISAYTNKPLHGKFRMRIGAEFLRGYL